MKKYLVVILFFASFTSYAQSQDADSVKETIRRFFDAMRNADSSSLRSTLASGAVFQTITRSNAISNQEVFGFITSVSQAAKGSLDERITFTTVHIDGNLAAAWTPYQFYYNGQFSHCGVNSFQLHKENGTWKIIYLIDTRRKEGCN